MLVTHSEVLGLGEGDCGDGALVMFVLCLTVSGVQLVPSSPPSTLPCLVAPCLSRLSICSLAFTSSLARLASSFSLARSLSHFCIWICSCCSLTLATPLISSLLLNSCSFSFCACMEPCQQVNARLPTQHCVHMTCTHTHTHVLNTCIGYGDTPL